MPNGFSRLEKLLLPSSTASFSTISVSKRSSPFQVCKYLPTFTHLPHFTSSLHPPTKEITHSSSRRPTSSAFSPPAVVTTFHIYQPVHTYILHKFFLQHSIKNSGSCFGESPCQISKRNPESLYFLIITRPHTLHHPMVFFLEPHATYF